jgi:hypothetical protein
VDGVNMTDRELISEIYWLIGQSDPSDASYRGALYAIAETIEAQREEIAKQVRERNRWPNQPLFKRRGD